MVFKTVYTEVEVDVDISEFDTDDLLEELEERGALPPEGNVNAKELVEQIYNHRQRGRDFGRELDQLFYVVLGKLV
jgi:hypothetical protein